MTTGDELADEDRTSENPDGPTDHGVSVHRTRPDRRVFTEEGNVDGWISTDLTVRLFP